MNSVSNNKPKETVTKEITKKQTCLNTWNTWTCGQYRWCTWHIQTQQTRRKEYALTCLKKCWLCRNGIIFRLVDCMCCIVIWNVHRAAIGSWCFVFVATGVLTDTWSPTCLCASRNSTFTLPWDPPGVFACLLHLSGSTVTWQAHSWFRCSPLRACATKKTLIHECVICFRDLCHLVPSEGHSSRGYSYTCSYKFVCFTVFRLLQSIFICTSKMKLKSSLSVLTVGASKCSHWGLWKAGPSQVERY